MEVEIALNELSITLAPDKYIACDRLRLFCELLAIITYNLGTNAPVLRTPRDLLSRTLAPNFNVHNWLNDPSVDKDSTTYFASIGSGTPFIDDALSKEDEDLCLTTEARFQDQIAKGLLFAYKRNGLALSMQSSNIWNAPFLDINVREIDENASIIDYSAKLKHSSNKENIDVHLPWIAQLAHSTIQDGKSLLSTRRAMFSRILFLGDTQQQIDTLGKNDYKLNSLIRSLISLQEYCKSWNTGGLDIGGLRANGLCIRTDSEGTLQEFGSEREYYDPNGKKRIFKWHFDINPGEWRGYIDWDDTKREIWLTYVGSHLETKRFH